MAKLPATKISSKVIRSFYLNSTVTLIVGFLSLSPLASNIWVAWLQDPKVCLALLTILSAIVGYQVEENAFDQDGK